MSEIFLRKLANGTLAGATEQDHDALKRFKLGATVRCEVKQMRNYEFHKKFFALLQFAFDQWSESEMPEYKGERVQPNFDRFRRDVTILAGYSYPVVAVNGEVRVEADSISFANMSEETFESLYSKTIDVILQKILYRKGYSEKQLRDLVEQTLAFS